MAQDFYKGQNRFTGAPRRSGANSLAVVRGSFLTAALSLACQSPQESTPERSPSPVPRANTGAAVIPTLENQVLDLINRERSRASLLRLGRNRALDSAARYHARNMARLQTLSHTLQGTGAPAFPDRIRMVGYAYSRIAENIAYGQRSATEVVDGWMTSTGHRENILSAQLTETGIGIARAPNGQLYFCQVFGRPR